MKKILPIGILFVTLTIFSGCGSGNTSDTFQAPPGKVLLEEFSDLQCPACKGAHPLVEKLKERFPNDVFVRFVHFPLEQIHVNAFHAAEAAECVRDQGDDKFWLFVEQAYKNQSSLNDETFIRIGNDIGLDENTFSECLDSNTKAGVVRRDMKEGLRRGVNATPTFFLEGEKVEDRRYEVMVKQIEELLQQQGNAIDTQSSQPENTTESMPE
jgi:protein-disulfide isomerase